MQKTYRQLEQDFKAGRDVDTNFGILREKICSEFFSLAGIELNMNYYSLCEGWNSPEKEGTYDGLYGLNDMRYTVSKCIRDLYDGKLDASSKETLVELRKDIIATTKLLLAYADTFNLYEYVLDRIVPSFEDNLADINDEKVIRDLLAEMFKGDDTFAMNENVKLMLKMFPVRITRNKFFDYCHEALKLYVGNSKDAFEKMIYFIKNGAGIDSLANEDKRFTSVFKLYEEFEKTDFAKIDKETAITMAERLSMAVRNTMEAVEGMRSIEEVANELLVLAETKPYANDDDYSQILALKAVYEEAESFFENKGNPEMSDKVEAIFTSLEGKLEYYAENMDKCDSALATAEGIDNLKDKSDIAMLKDCQKLMSSSLFVEIDEETNDAELTEKEFEASFEALRKEYEAKLKESSRMLSRARMANTLYQLPVFFKNRTEVLNYMLNSLGSCSDKAEKLVAVRTYSDALKETQFDYQ